MPQQYNNSQYNNDDAVLFMVLDRKTSKTGGTYYTGRLGLSDVVGFEKKDGTGIYLKMKSGQRQQAQGQRPQHPYAPGQQSRPKPIPRPQTPPSNDPPTDLWDGEPISEEFI